MRAQSNPFRHNHPMTDINLELPKMAKEMSLPTSELLHLKPRNAMGLIFVTGCVGLTAVSVFLSTMDSRLNWLSGQILLSVALIQWFALLHEAGHQTLFRARLLNNLVGHLASIFSGIPFDSWRRVHNKHHVWTGWQDLDLTTAPLVPRKLRQFEKVLVNICWKFWIPLFSVLYRLNNFWNIPRLAGEFPKQHLRRMTWNILALLAVYSVLAYLIGFSQLLRLFGFGFLISLVFQDPLLLSQHTHVPQNLSFGNKVSPFPAAQQEAFTRSLKFPSWFSICVLINFDSHELHHMYVQVPGYYLGRIDYIPQNQVHWWRWIAMAKRVPGEVFLFQNRWQSGLNL